MISHLSIPSLLTISYESLLFSLPLYHRPAPSLRATLLTIQNFRNAKRFHFSQKAGSYVFRKHHQPKDELIKGRYVACIIIYLDQHLGKYYICHFSIVRRVSRDPWQPLDCSVFRLWTGEPRTHMAGAVKFPAL